MNAARLVSVLLRLGPALLGPPAMAQTAIAWNNGGTDFTSNASWTGGTAPANNTTSNLATFNLPLTTQPTVSGARSVAGVVFTGSSGSATLSGTGPLTLGSSGVSQQGSGSATATVSVPLTLGSSATISNAAAPGGSSPTLTLSGAMSVNSTSLTVSGNGNTTISGAVSGSVVLTKNGSGIMALTGNNSFTGIINLNAGALRFSANGLGPSTNTLNIVGSATALGVQLHYTGATPFTLANNLGIYGGYVVFASGNSAGPLNHTGIISGDGTLLLTNASATLALRGANTYTGGTSIVNGFQTTIVGHDSAFGTGTLNVSAALLDAESANRVIANPLALNASAGMTTTGNFRFTGNGTLTGTNVLDIQGTTEFSGNLSGTGGISASSSGTLKLTGNNSFTGGVTLGGFHVTAVGSDTAFGTGTLTLTSAILDAGSANRVLANPLALSGTANVTTYGNFRFSGNGTLTGSNALVVEGTTEFAGSLGGTGGISAAGSGTLKLSGSNSFAGGVTMTGATLQLANASGSATGSGNVTVAAGATLSGTGSFTGALALSGAMTPGGSFAGHITTGAQTWVGGGSLTWQLRDGLGAAGASGGWDLVTVNGMLQINATQATPFTVYVGTTDGVALSPGLASNFDPLSGATWTILSASGGISGLTASNVVLDVSGFTNSYGGAFSLAQSGTDLNLVYSVTAVPEPATSALLGGVIALAGAAYRRQRRNAARSAE